jgi:hypothetical protein
MNRVTACLLVCVLMIQSFAVVSAAEQPASAVEVKMTIGNPEVLVNGEALQVKAPVVVGSSTLVPLRVITAAFSAELEWIAETQGIVLTYGDQIIELQIGSNNSTVNGETKTILGAPQLIESTTMVPVRFISETFGADVQFEAVTQSISIIGDKSASAAATETNPTGINNDEGKTKIGDSHWAWTIDYPTGLVQDFQSFSGDSIYFEDANGEYTIDITIDNTQPNMKESGLLNELSEYVYGGTVLDKRLVGPEEGASYAKIISKSSYGDGYNEDRAYLKDGVIYILSFQILDAANYKNPSKSAVYNDLINSFTPSFDAKDSSVKDVSPVKDGYIHHVDKDYGITLDLPANWSMNDDDSGLNFYSYEDDFELVFTMTSLEDGQTLKSWVDSHKARFMQDYLPDYREILELPSTRVDGTSATALIWSSSLGGDWLDTYDIYLIKGDYKYNFSFAYHKADRAKFKETIERIVKSIDIDESVAEEMFGYLEDEYAIDLTETQEISNDQFSITIPMYWTEGYMSSEDYFYYEYGAGNSIQITSEEDIEVAEAVTQIEEMLKGFGELDKSIKIIDKKSESFNGMPATKLVFEANDYDKNLVQSTVYLFKKNDLVYSVESEMYKANMTEQNIKRVTDTLATLTFE